MKILHLAIPLAFAALIHADDATPQIITLKDQSVIRAKVTEVSGGFYHATSPSLGTMKIPTGDVLSITPDPAAAPQEISSSNSLSIQSGLSSKPAPQSSPLQAGTDSLQSAVSSKVQDLVSSKEGMNAVMAFSENKDLKAVMNDPQIMKAIQSGDYGALMKSPAIKTLLENPQTKSLIQSVLGAKQANPSPKSAAPGN